jgi:hypothetical protein
MEVRNGNKNWMQSEFNQNESFAGSDALLASRHFRAKFRRHFWRRFWCRGS